MQDSPDSGWWVRAFTRHVDKIAAFIMMDAYDQYRLWDLSEDSIGFIGELDLLSILGNAENVTDLLQFVVIIEFTEWERVDSMNRVRLVKGDLLFCSPGRVSLGGTFIGNVLWRKVRVSHKERL